MNKRAISSAHRSTLIVRFSHNATQVLVSVHRFIIPLCVHQNGVNSQRFRWAYATTLCFFWWSLNSIRCQLSVLLGDPDNLLSGFVDWIHLVAVL